MRDISIKIILSLLNREIDLSRYLGKIDRNRDMSSRRWEKQFRWVSYLVPCMIYVYGEKSMRVLESFHFLHLSCFWSVGVLWTSKPSYVDVLLETKILCFISFRVALMRLFCILFQISNRFFNAIVYCFPAFWSVGVCWTSKPSYLDVFLVAKILCFISFRVALMRLFCILFHISNRFFNAIVYIFPAFPVYCGWNAASF